MFIFSVFVCTNLVYTMWCTWMESPVIISFDHKPLSMSEIPFPAMTICSDTKTKVNIFNYTRVYRLMTKLEVNNERPLNQTE